MDNFNNNRSGKNNSTSLKSSLQQDLENNKNPEQTSIPSIIFSVISFNCGLSAFIINLVFYFDLITIKNQTVGAIVLFLYPSLSLEIEIAAVVFAIISLSMMLVQRKRKGRKMLPFSIIVILGILLSFFSNFTLIVQTEYREDDLYYASVIYDVVSDQDCKDDELNRNGNDYIAAVDSLCSFGDYYNDNGSFPTSQSDLIPYSSKTLHYLSNTFAHVSELSLKSRTITIGGPQPPTGSTINIIAGKTCKNIDSNNYVSAWYEYYLEKRACVDYKYK